MLCEVPACVCERVLELLSDADLARACAVSRAWRAAAGHEQSRRLAAVCGSLRATPSCPATAPLPPVKVVVIGEHEAGKTALVARLARGERPAGVSEATVGATLTVKDVRVPRAPLRLEIWDTAGQERYKALLGMYWGIAAVAVVAFDLGARPSLQWCRPTVDDLRRHSPAAIPVILCGCKSDLPRAVSEQEGRALAAEMGANHYIETSSATGENVSVLFRYAAALGMSREGAAGRGDAQATRTPPPSPGISISIRAMATNTNGSSSSRDGAVRLRIDLDESRIPTAWYNIQADLPQPMPPMLHPATRAPVTPADLAPLFPPAIVAQELNSTDRYIAIPEEVREVYKKWRPTPLFRAAALEKAVGTRCRIFYKHEGVSPSGSHKSNTSVPQAYYNAQAGVRKITTETGAGQWGSALSYACGMYGIECEVFMVRSSYEHKPYRRSLMHIWGATVHSSPSTATAAGRRVLAEDPRTPGSLGIAISEAVESALGSQTPAKYALGSVLNHVLLHQTVIGLEAEEQLRSVGVFPDVVVGCFGGGSNFAGVAFPFLRHVLAGERAVRVVAAEPECCPKLSCGDYAYDYGDVAGMTPLMPMFTLGHGYVPPAAHAGGLRYHGAAPLVSHVARLGHVAARSVAQGSAFEAGVLFARTEGVVPAPESSHAIAVALQEAREADAAQRPADILFCLSGHGHFDLAGYDEYLAGAMEAPQSAGDRARLEAKQGVCRGVMPFEEPARPPVL
eukprot:m51a1_g7905 putative tryptophan synthase subunit beta (738) ;mRNA; r:158036-161264